MRITTKGRLKLGSYYIVLDYTRNKDKISFQFKYYNHKYQTCYHTTYATGFYSKHQSHARLKYYKYSRRFPFLLHLRDDAHAIIAPFYKKQDI